MFYRLNFSHGDHNYHSILIKRIRAIAGRLDIPVAILQDISGPKIRVGHIEEMMLLEAGDTLRIYPDKTTGRNFEITINHPEVLSTLQKGDAIYFADAAIRTEVIANSPDCTVVKVLTGGKLTSQKGVNFPVTDLKLDVITAKDREDIAFGIEQNVDYIALSFIRTA